MNVNDRASAKIDVFHYHIANNDRQTFSVDAAVEGPPGILVVHDASQHHRVEEVVLGKQRDPDAFREFFGKAHGPVGAKLAELRLGFAGTETERFLFDFLKPFLMRHYGAIVHNAAAAERVRGHCPELLVWNSPHFIPNKTIVPRPRADLGLPDGKLIIGHFGYITLPKRPALILRAFANLIHAGIPAHLLLGGYADAATLALVKEECKVLNIEQDVTLTGYLDEELMDQLIAACDFMVSLRFPHTCESSGTVAQALAAGKPIVVHNTGSWAEIPTSCTIHVPMGETQSEVAALTDAFKQLADPELRAAMGAAGQEYARNHLSIATYAKLVMEASRDVAALTGTPTPEQKQEQFEKDVARFAASHSESETLLLHELPRARSGERLLCIGLNCANEIRSIWGYEPVPVITVDEISNAATAGAAAAVWAAPIPGVHIQVALAEINRTLGALGLLILKTDSLGSGGDWEAALTKAGFSVARGSEKDVVVARKVFLPAPRPLAASGVL